MSDQTMLYIGAKIDATMKHQIARLARLTHRSESQMLRLLLQCALADPRPEILFEKLARQALGAGPLPSENAGVRETVHQS
jgi:hypothetical protein